MDEERLTREEFVRLYEASLSYSLPGMDAERERYANAAMIERLWRITEQLDERGKNLNLTAIRGAEEIIRLHLLDSLIPLAILRERGIRFDSLLDVGTGAGFPLLPMASAMAETGVRFAGLDATAKKAAYVRECAAAAGLTNVEVITARAEEAGRGEMRESFGLVTARAVASLPILLELCAPFVEIGGHFCALKGRVDAELEEAGGAARLLGLGEAERIEYALSGGEVRSLLIYEKKRATPPRFPRRYAEIKKRPLK